MRAEERKIPARPENQSGLVRSSQVDVHPRLAQCVRRHLATPWIQPPHRPTIGAYRHLLENCELSAGRPFILDSGCGTGKSTQRLAGIFPGQLVIGIDRSHTRLAKSGAASSLVLNENYVLLRAELATFWRLLAADGHLPEKHFLLYPNPWPKPQHLRKRWHGHPVFPVLLSLGGEIEMRCNWEIYALEFAQAVSIATGHSIRAREFQVENGLSPFEQKYLGRGQSLYAVTVPRVCTEDFQRSFQAV